jgi:hypothetical protein
LFFINIKEIEPVNNALPVNNAFSSKLADLNKLFGNKDGGGSVSLGASNTDSITKPIPLENSINYL